MSQFQESRGVPARDLNQAVTDLVAENRERWDALLRTIIAPPGDTAIPLTLPSSATRASKFLGFDANGGLAVFTPGAGSGGNVVGPASSTNNNLSCFNGATGLVIKDCAVGFPIPVASGGTGQITAPLARTAAGLNIDSYTPRGDSNYTILPTDRTVGTSAALTTPRTWTLPAANSVNPGQTLTVVDYAGGVTSVNTLTVARAGSDTISGNTSVVINSAYGRYDLRADGISRWTASTSTASSGSRTPLDYGAACDGTTNDSTALQAWLDALPTSGTGTIPPGKTCIHTGALYVKSNTVINGHFSTIKAANAATGSTTGIHMTDATWAGTGPSNVTITNLRYDGNRSTRTPGSGQAAAFYAIGAANIRLENITAVNCVADCFYAGQAGASPPSTNVLWDHLVATNADRNGGSIVGVQGMSAIGLTFGGSIGTSPQSGLDIEPDNAGAGINSGVFISNSSFDGNAGNGMNAICVIAAQCNLRSGGNNVTASSNGGYGFLASSTSTNFRWCSINGTANTTAISSGVTDKCPP